MVVSVSFHGPQRAVTGTREMELSLCNGTRVNHVLSAVQEQFPNLPLRGDDLLITVNNQVSSLDHLLKEKDSVSLLPHIGGG